MTFAGASPKIRLLLLLLLSVAGRLRRALLKELFVFLVGEIHAVHPGVRHLVDCAIAVTHPLVRIRVVLVRLRVVVEGGHVDDRSLREHRRRVVGVDVVGHPVEVEVADVADDLALAVRQDRLDLHRLAAQVEVGLEVGDDRVVPQHREALGAGDRVRRDIQPLRVIDAAEGDEIAPVLRLFTFRVEPETEFRAAGDLFANRVDVLIPRDLLAGKDQLAGAGPIEVVALADRPLQDRCSARDMRPRDERSCGL